MIYENLEGCEAYHKLCHELDLTEGQAYGLLTDVRISGTASIAHPDAPPAVTVTAGEGGITIEVHERS